MVRQGGGRIIDPRQIPGGVNFADPNAQVPQAPSPIAQLAMALQEFSQKHNMLAQKMQIMAAQQQTLVEILKRKTDLTDEELTQVFEETATLLGFEIVKKQIDADGNEIDEEPADADPEADTDEPDGGADSSLPDGEQDLGATEGSGSEEGPSGGGAS